jgi:DNA-binding response OmpR family regulator
MKTILAADDDKHFLQVLARFLSHAGYAVITAQDGEAALALAQQIRPDLLVLDVALPLLSGEQVAAQVEHRPPVLFISGRDLDRLPTPGDPTIRHLRKPADLDEILETIQALLEEPGVRA